MTMNPAVVLIVEDEALVRVTLNDSLSEAGYRVLEAANADEALLILHARADIGLLVTDVEMPGSLNGFALAREARSRWPSIPVMVASGRSRPGPGDLPEEVQFLAKPFTMQQFTDEVGRTLAASEKPT